MYIKIPDKILADLLLKWTVIIIGDIT